VKIVTIIWLLLLLPHLESSYCCRLSQLDLAAMAEGRRIIRICSTTSPGAAEEPATRKGLCRVLTNYVQISTEERQRGMVFGQSRAHASLHHYSCQCSGDAMHELCVSRCGDLCFKCGCGLRRLACMWAGDGKLWGTCSPAEQWSEVVQQGWASMGLHQRVIIRPWRVAASGLPSLSVMA
jgi:hypothetical protein